MERLKKWRQIAQAPLLLLCIVLIVHFAWSFFDLPPRDELIAIIKSLIVHYGFGIVLVGSFLEGLLFIGWYFPGSFVIFLAVILAPTPVHAAFSVFIVTLGLYAAYVTNFFLGKYGWYRVLVRFGIKEQLNEAENKISKYGLKAIFLSYWSPGLAAFISTAAGILTFPVRKFLLYSLLAVTVWDIFWGITVYSLGESALDAFFNWWFIFLAVALWIGIRFWEQRK